MKNGKIKNHPYAKFDPKQLILRDELAIDRTLLANERTLLAYLRSGVALVVAGISIMHFSLERWFWVTGLVCIPIGVLAALVGILRFRRMNKAIAVIRRKEKTVAGEVDLDEISAED